MVLGLSSGLRLTVPWRRGVVRPIYSPTVPPLNIQVAPKSIFLPSSSKREKFQVPSILASSARAAGLGVLSGFTGSLTAVPRVREPVPLCLPLRQVKVILSPANLAMMREPLDQLGWGFFE